MSRLRLAIVAGVLVIFIAAGAYLLFANKKPAPQNRTFNLTVTDAKSMTPPEIKVNQNDTVTINISSNVTGEVHLHGYDIAFACVAGQVVSHAFKATISGGPFDIEWESTSTRLGDLIVNP
jgi:FtsP/CotA-like multicopper oxidase with cupredoxin domain